MIDMDTLSAELTRELAFSPLEKKLPPKLLYRFRKWMKQFHSPHGPKANMATVQKSVERAFEHAEAVKELKKNEILTSVYDNGCIRMDFGGSVDAKVKNAAMKWAKNRGLKASEASLDKSTGASSYVVYSRNASIPHGIPCTWVKHSSKT